MDEIEKWMVFNKLQLNGEKTDFVITGSTSLLKKLNISTIKVSDSTVWKSPYVKNLGVIFDSHLSMEQQVSALCKSCDHQIHMIGKIVKFMTPRATEQIVHSFVTSRLDNCNSLLFGSPDKLIHRLGLQLIQLRAARLITHTKKHDHITPVMRSLHWSPVRSRIIFKILLLVYKSIHGLAPVYLSELIKPYAPEFNLRSGMKNRLKEPRTGLVTFGDRAFYKADPTLWNKLPTHITSSPTLSSFKQNLKTHLFIHAYDF